LEASHAWIFLGSREKQIKMLQVSFVAVLVEAALGWVPCLEVAQAARGFPSAASRARLEQLLKKFGLSAADGFGSHVKRLYKHIIVPLRLCQNCALTAQPAQVAGNGPIRQVRVRYLPGHRWQVLALERIDRAELKNAFTWPGFGDAVERLQAEGENFFWLRTRNDRVVGEAYLILKCKETTWLRSTVHGFEIELKMVRTWELDEDERWDSGSGDESMDAGNV